MSYVSTHLKNLVRQRAQGRCEYCLYPEAESLFRYEMEHVMAEKHGGKTDEANLALACPYCNRFKGTDLGSIDPESGRLTAFFNPRTQQWHDHFQLDGATINALTPEGRVTILILQFNQPIRVQERQQLINVNKYP